MNAPAPSPRVRIARVVAALVAVAIAVGTLWPMPDMPQPYERFCIICGTLGGIDFLGNIGLFVPLGVALRLAGVGTGRVVAVGAGFSLLIEALQWHVIAGRDASFGDLVSNTTGTALGALVTAWLPVLWRPPARTARRLAGAWSVLGVALGAVGAWALRPAPVDLVYWSQWEPVRGTYTPFDGHLIGLGLGGRPRPNGTPIDPTEEEPRYGAGLLDVRALLRPGARDGGTKLIARAGNPIAEEFEIAQHDDALLFRARRNAARLALRSPTAVVEHAFPADLTLAALHLQADSATLTIAVGVPNAERVHVVALTLGTAWRTLTPFEVRSASADVPMRGAMLALLVLPLAYWGVMGLGLAGGLAAAVALGAAVLGPIPALARITSWGAAEVVGGLLGVVIGAGLALSVARTSGAAAHRSP